jgi:imipenem/basic amino acid-specific outer membrane pore
MRNLKKICLALAAVNALGISAYAGALQEAITGGKVSGEIRSVTVMSSYSDNTEAGPYNNANSSAIALQLNYKTADFKGFKAEVGFQAGHSLDLEDSSAAADAPKFYNENESRVTQEGSNLYLANVSYATGNTEAKVGRQLISTPLMSYSDANPMVDTYNGLSVVNKDLSNTEIRIYVLKDWIERYSADTSASDDAKGDDRITHWKKPTLSLYVKNTSIESLTLEGQYLGVRDEEGNPNDAPVATNDSYKVYYGAFEYKLPVGMPLSIGSFYTIADYDSTVSTGASKLLDKNDTDMYGVKLGGKIGETAFKVAYTKVGDDGDFIGNLGHTPNLFKYNGGQMFTDNFYAGESSTSLMLIPKLIPDVFTLFAISKYSQTEQGKKNTSRGADMDGAIEIMADLRYNLTKELTARLQVAEIDFDSEKANTDDKMTIGKLYLTYKF